MISRISFCQDWDNYCLQLLTCSLTPTTVCVFVRAPQPFSSLTDSLLLLFLWSWLNTDSAMPDKLTSLFLQSVIKSFIHKDVHQCWVWSFMLKLQPSHFTVTSVVRCYPHLCYGQNPSALSIYDLRFKVLLCIVPLNTVDYKTRCTQLLLWQ